MTVDYWFKNDGDYKNGVELYAALPNCNPNFLKIFQKRNTPHNLMKLKYELQKELSITDTPVSTPEPKSAYNASKYNRKVLINELPISLHPLYIKQKSDYTLACSLKMQLNNLGHLYDASGNLIIGEDGLPKPKRLFKADKEKALQLALKIEDLFDAIDKTWEIIDYYLENKVVMEVKQNDYNTFTEGQVRDKIASIRPGLTRQKQRLAQQKELYKNAVAKKFKERAKRNIAKAKQKIFQFNQDLIKLQERKDELNNEKN